MLLAGFGRLVQLGVLLVVAGFALDRLLHLPALARAWVLVVSAALMLWQTLCQVIRPLTRPLTDLDLAVELERRVPACRDVMAGAVSLAGQDAAGSLALRSAAVREAEQAARTVDAGSLIGWRRPFRSVALAVLFVGVLASVALHRPATARLWLRRNVLLAPEPWPRRTHLRLLDFPDGVRYVARGADVEVTAVAEGVVPRLARLHVRPAGKKAGSVLDMQHRPPKEFAAVLENVTGSLVLQVRGGDGISRELQLQAVPRPQVESARVVVRPPEYISRRAFEMPWEATEFAAPAGSRVKVELTATRPISKGEWTLDGKPAQTMELVAERTVRGSFVLEENIECEFALTGEHGIRMRPALRATFRAVPDEPPRVSLSAPGTGSLLTPTARVPLRVVAMDDYAAETGRLELSGTAHDDPTVLPLWDGHTTPVRRGEYALDLPEIGYEPGDRLELTAVVLDNREPDGPNVGRSVPLEFRIVRVEELLRSLLGQQEDLRRSLEQHIRTQQAIVRRLGETDDANLPQLAREQAELGAELPKLAKAYAHILEQLRNNRVVEDAAHQARVAEIVAPLEALGQPEGAVALAADAVKTSRRHSRRHAEEAVRQMDKVRQAMLLVEGGAAVAASVMEIREAQRSIFERAADPPEDLLDWLEGDR